MGDLDTPGVPEKKGFDRFFGYYHQIHAHNYYPEYLIDTGQKLPLAGNRGFYAKKPAAGPFPVRDPESGLERQFSAHLIQGEMLSWLGRQTKGPFFCYAPWTIPHGSHEIPESDPAWMKYKDKPWNVAARVHAAFVTMADRFVGETMAQLEDLGCAQNTLVFFSSDNGAANSFRGSLNSGGELRGQKTQLYEGGIRIPFFARLPGRIQAGSSSNLPIYFPDVLPTIADITQTTRWLPSAIDGASFAGEALGRAKLSRSRPMYWEWNNDHFELPYRVSKQACRRGPWKIVRHDTAQPWELYNLAEDSRELHDLATIHPPIVKELTSWVDAHRVDPPEQIEPQKPTRQQWR